MSIFLMALVSSFQGKKKKKLSTLGNQLKGTVICQIVNQVPALARIMSIQNCCKLQCDMSFLSPSQQQAWCECQTGCLVFKPLPELAFCNLGVK